MNNEKEKLPYLLKQYLRNQMAPEEYDELWELLNKEDADNTLANEMSLLWQEAKAVQITVPDKEWSHKLQLLKTELDNTRELETTISMASYRRRNYWWAAAAVFIFSATIFYFLHTRTSVKENPIASTKVVNKHANDIQPGSNRAQLTLVDGRIIFLDSSGNGELATQGAVKIIKRSDGQLVYNITEGAANEKLYNTLTTPRGGQYNITLADGTKVWLNASSSLKYPATFADSERSVEVTGEAYFEVAKDAGKPFKVKINQMEVEVLGTHFNINGYSDEALINTTLLEGKVNVKAPGIEKQLKPGQQAQLDKKNNIQVVNTINTEEVMAWKDGNFQFEESDIHAVMRQLGRWYDVEVEYSGNVNKHFVGTISRNVNLSQVLTMLQQTGEISLRIDGKRIIVSP